MTVHRIRYTGPPALAVGVATLLADADGVDMISSHQPLLVDEHTVELDMSVEATADAAADAIATIGDDLPDGASIELVDD